MSIRLKHNFISINWSVPEHHDIIGGREEDGRLSFYRPKVEKGELCLVEVFPNEVFCVSLLLKDLLRMELFILGLSLFLIYMLSNCSVKQVILDCYTNFKVINLMLGFNILGLFFIAIKGKSGHYVRIKYDTEAFESVKG